MCARDCNRAKKKNKQTNRRKKKPTDRLPKVFKVFPEFEEKHCKFLVRLKSSESKCTKISHVRLMCNRFRCYMISTKQEKQFYEKKPLNVSKIAI